MKTYRLEIPSGETGVTAAATWDTSCAPVPQDFTHTDDSGNNRTIYVSFSE